MLMRRDAGAIKTTPVDVDSLVLDQDVYAAIVADMENFGPEATPGPQWVSAMAQLDRLAGAVRFGDLLPFWMGAFNIQPMSEVYCAECATFLDTIGRRSMLDLLPRIPTGNLRNFDLNTIIDLALIDAFPFSSAKGGTLRLLEIGGGHGRLCEGMLNVGGEGINYVLADAVPESIYFCYAYLKRALPDRKIGLYYQDKDADPFDFDCFVLPTWRLSELPTSTFDAAVNLSSFQEMEDFQIRHYVDKLKALTHEGSRLYFLNSRDFIRPREYAYPSNWRCLYKARTPRSRTIDMPFEVFEVSSADSAKESAILQQAYLTEVVQTYRQEQVELKLRIGRNSQDVARLRVERDAALARVEAGRVELDRLRSARDALQARQDAVRATVDRVRAERDAFEARIEAARAELQRIRKERDDLRERLESSRDDLERIRDERDGVQARLQMTRHALERVREERDQADARVGAMRNELARIRTERDAALAARREDRADRDRLRTERDELQTRLASARDASVRFRDERDHVVDRLAAEKAEAVRLRDDRDKWRARVADDRGDLARVRSDRDALRQRLDAVREDLARLRQERDRLRVTGKVEKNE